LRFEGNDNFVILQLSDLMMDDDAESYLQTQALIENLVYQERPDLVLLTGDIVDPAIVQGKHDYSRYFGQAMEFILQSQIPWIWTGGNPVNGVDRKTLLQIDKEYGGDLSWSGYKWDMDEIRDGDKIEKTGYFTGRVPIFDKEGREEIMSVYTLDSESHSDCKSGYLPGESCISSQAIDWFDSQQNKYSHNHRHRDFVFTHKPIQEFMTLANLYEITGHKQQAVGCQAMNTGLFATAMESGRVEWIGAGSDADNDFAGKYHWLWLSFARKSGYSGKGSLPRGARVFQLEKKENQFMTGSSYIVNDDGEKNVDMDTRAPPSFQFAHQAQCSKDVFEDIFLFPEHLDGNANSSADWDESFFSTDNFIQ